MAKQNEPVSKAGDHEILAVGDGARDWQTKSDPPREMRSYRIKLRDTEGNEHGNVELAQLQTTAPPVAGQKLNGHVERRFYGDNDEKVALQFKKAARGGGGGGGRAWKPRPDDAPVVYAAKQAQIVAQHSQNMALRVLELAHATGTDDWAGIMADLGVSLDPPEGSQKPLGLVDAFARHASMAAATAWLREKEKHAVADALAELA